tara:strand:- start:49522 stop:50529 length:1008 start_codon:yes stop_codon:yes gene_type:complete
VRTYILSLILVLGALSKANAASGAISGGGGTGVVCRDKLGAITSAKTLDLYEGTVLYNLPIQYSSDSVDDQVRKALDVMPPQTRGLVEAYAYGVSQNMQIVRGVTLQPINDALIVAVPSGCKAEQIANYFSDKHILINGDIWDALAKTDQAALMLHEAVYRVARMLGATNSQRSRHVVASLFSTNTKWTDLNEGLPNDRLFCVGKGVQFYAYQDINNAWKVQFTVLGGNFLMSKTTFSGFFENDPSFDFNEAKTFPVVSGEDKIGQKFLRTGYTNSSFENADIISFNKIWEPIKDNQGNRIPGYQTPRYYISWQSSTYPNVSTEDQMINCSVVLY